MRIVTIDFETYYSSDYSLRKLSQEEYIRDSRFQSLMLSYAVNDEPEQIAIGRQAIEQALISLRLHEKDTITVAHNAGFEGGVLEWRYGVRVNALVCTMAMARGSGLGRLTKVSLESLAEFFNQEGLIEGFKGDEIGSMKDKRLEDFTAEELSRAVDYCKNDVHITRKIFKLMLPLMYRGSLDVIDMTLRMFTRPMFELDIQKLTDYEQRIRRQKEEILNRLAEVSGVSKDNIGSVVRSPKQFPILFKKLTGIDLPTKISESKTKTFRARLEKAKEAGDEAVQVLIENTPMLEEVNGNYVVYTYATAKDDLEFQELGNSSNELVSTLVETKLTTSSSLHENRAEKMIAIGKRGLLPITLVFASAHTGRYGGGGGINPQNLPSRGDRTIRESLLAPRGYCLIAGDSSQIEARLLAYIARQMDVLNLFATGGDVYVHMASRIYGKSYEWIMEWKDKPKDGLTAEELEFVRMANNMRKMGKEAVLASGYQMSGRAFALRLKTQGTMIEPMDKTGMSDEELDVYHEAEANRINRVYRDSNVMIVNLWRRCQTILDELVAGGSGYFGGEDDRLFYYGHRDMYGKKVPGIMMPNGFWIIYPGLKKQLNKETGYEEFVYRAVDKGHWRTYYVYGGKVVENITQTIAFAVLQDQALLLRERGVPIILNIHDEWATCVPIERRDEVLQIFNECMSVVPEYIKGCPLACEVGYGFNYGDV